MDVSCRPWLREVSPIFGAIPVWFRPHPATKAQLGKSSHWISSPIMAAARPCWAKVDVVGVTRFNSSSMGLTLCFPLQALEILLPLNLAGVTENIFAFTCPPWSRALITARSRDRKADTDHTPSQPCFSARDRPKSPAPPAARGRGVEIR
jgi:hypothetical protein